MNFNQSIPKEAFGGQDIVNYARSEITAWKCILNAWGYYLCIK